MNCSCGGDIVAANGRMACLSCGCDYGEATSSGLGQAPPSPVVVQPAPPTIQMPPPSVSSDQYEFRVLPFVANITQQQGSAEAASQLQQVISQYSGQGWEFVRLETVETFINGDSGCLGFGSTDSRWERYKVIVIRRKK